ncbi:MAG: hypothetical protein OXI19_06955, partial [Gemmatimonadota bacterium]|nr:hypothetical protein [Gemmatimonadota bacterium]
MTRERGEEKREQLTRNGYCHVEGVLSAEFLGELRQESDRLLDAAEYQPEWRYQGSDIHVDTRENAVMRRLLDWPATGAWMRAMKLDDFTPNGTI